MSDMIVSCFFSCKLRIIKPIKNPMPKSFATLGRTWFRSGILGDYFFDDFDWMYIKQIYIKQIKRIFMPKHIFCCFTIEGIEAELKTLYIYTLYLFVVKMQWWNMRLRRLRCNLKDVRYLWLERSVLCRSLTHLYCELVWLKWKHAIYTYTHCNSLDTSQPLQCVHLIYNKTLKFAQWSTVHTTLQNNKKHTR